MLTAGGPARRRSRSRPDGRCAACRRRRLSFDRAVAAGSYEGPLRSLVLAHKFRGDRGARSFLVEALVRVALRESLPRRRSGAAPVVTSVPSHPLKRLLRGREPVGELARDLARELRLPYRSLLAKARWTRPQVALPREERERSPRRSYRARGRAPAPPHVILVDDVLTTCTTAAECSRVLKRAGALEVVVLAIARS